MTQYKTLKNIGYILLIGSFISLIITNTFHILPIIVGILLINLKK